MIGAIIGDIVGSRFEYIPHKRKEFDLFAKDCRFTDDSVLTLAVAKAILETDRIRTREVCGCGNDDAYYAMLEILAVRQFVALGKAYPNSDYGLRFTHWLQSDDHLPYNSYGNGAAMRVSPAGFAAKSEKEAIYLARAATKVTHNHPEGLKGAEAVALAIFLARTGASKEQIRERMVAGYYELDFSIDQIRADYRFDESCQNTVPQALVAFLESESFEDAIRTAVSLGGDSDTLTAICGSIAEAFYGVPKDLELEALGYLDTRLRGIYDSWQERYGNEPLDASAVSCQCST